MYYVYDVSLFVHMRDRNIKNGVHSTNGERVHWQVNIKYIFVNMYTYYLSHMLYFIQSNTIIYSLLFLSEIYK